MRRSASLLIAVSLGACVALQSCLVPNKDLVDSLPGSAGTSATGATGATDAIGDGGTDSVGGSATAGMGGRTNGGSSSAGTSSGGSTGANGGTGSGTDGGSPNPDSGGAPSWHFGDTTSCSGSFLFCDDFEKVNQSWPAGAAWSRSVITDAPSGTHVMQTGFHNAPLGFHHAEFSLSFWVRFQGGAPGNVADQAFITWPRAQSDLTFGIEGSVYHFRTELNGVAAVAPERPEDTQDAVINTWTCVKLVAKAQQIRATVTVFGQQPVELPLIGGAPDAGIDQKLMQATPGNQLAFDIGDWYLAEPGTDIELDDVRVGAADQRTICDDYNDSL